MSRSSVFAELLVADFLQTGSSVVDQPVKSDVIGFESVGRRLAKAATADVLSTLASKPSVPEGKKFHTITRLVYLDSHKHATLRGRVFLDVVQEDCFVVE
jgi:hypothetical protein